MFSAGRSTRAGSLPQPERSDAAALRRLAHDDLVLVRMALDDHEISDRIAGFHAEQAVEKLMKAVLDARGIEYPFTHDLRRLRELLERSGGAPPVDSIAVTELIAYAVEQRYGGYETEPVDRAELFALAEQVAAWAAAELDR